MTKHRHISRHEVGGVALTNGVLLHTEDAGVLAIRGESGEIITKSWSLPPEKKVHPFFQLFLIRGIWLLSRTIIWNSRMRQFVDNAIKSPQKKSVGGKTLPQPHHIPTSLFPTVGLLAAFLLYAEVVFSMQMFYQYRTGQSLAFQNDLIIALMVLLMLIYVVWHGGIWRYMGYHGAEHQAIHAFEDGKTSVRAISEEWPFQARCGAAVVSFEALLLVFTGWLWPNIGFWQSVSLAIALFGVSYEIVLFLDHHANVPLMQFCSLPGVVLQFLVARHPDPDQSEVAARALAELVHVSRAIKTHTAGYNEMMMT